jgi:uncharacterized membrane protein required for colicin V production
MNVDVDVDVFFSLFDGIILLMLIWGGYRGYVKGAIIESVTLFALAAFTVIDVFITKLIYHALSEKSNIPDLFAAVLLGSFFILAIWASNIVSVKVKNNVGDIKKGTYNRLIGMGLGIAKFFLIAGIYVITIYKIDNYANFLPKSEKHSKLANASKWAITLAFPNLKFDSHSSYKDTLDLEKEIKEEIKTNENF